MPKTAAATKEPFLKGSVLWQKKGPLPVWAWAIIGLAVLFVIMWWRRNKAAAASAEVATGQENPLPGNQGAPPIFIMPQGPAPSVTVPITVTPPAGRVPAVPRIPSETVPTAPPGGGASNPRVPPLAQAPEFASVPIESNLYEWIKGLNNDYPALGLTLERLRVFNPDVDTKYIRWRDTGEGWKMPYFPKDWSGHGLGIPALRIR